ncbi:hypothetical protein BIV57_01000 [Mangrovactinospora gilvigrisea]|uniref:Uncharacterized protein n=1 Tax=Mangrovactinospora gilvigrisea TaxID=1428644 RepID=A0A1J7CD04_9ACTN|nr:hypothetical protein [Mangrovactinospora gilvigrisea]OIV39444.1 hypothetical protein BIV57_01000 [Mangrovactinospora gilvigrisea]
MTPSQAVDQIIAIRGARTATVVDYYARLSLASRTRSSDLDPSAIAAVDTDVFRAELDALKAFGYEVGALRDITVSLLDRSHIIVPVLNRGWQGVFLHLALDRGAELAGAQDRLREVARAIEV